MLRFITVALALAAVAAEESSPHKVFRVIPESEEQLKVLQNLDSDVEGVSKIICYFNVECLPYTMHWT